MDYDLAYANADFIPDAMSFPPRWARSAEGFRLRQGARARLAISYGPGPREKLDLFLPKTPPDGLMMFVHGGYWRQLHRSDFSHLAAGALERGLAVAMPSYTLAPEARISEITRQIAAALRLAARQVDGPVVLAGHSAGGQLVARMNCADVALPDAVAARIRRIVAISPLADLRPLLKTSMNADLRLDEAEAEAESPMLHKDRRKIETLVWVGAEERPAFLDQAQWLDEAWDEATRQVAPGRHHFDVIDALEIPDSPLMKALLAKGA